MPLKIGSIYYNDPYFAQHFDHRHYNIVKDADLDNIDHMDMVILWGGADIQPSIYGQEDVHCGHQIPQRDSFEIAAYNRAVQAGVPILGVCRGAQLLCALTGGTLWQHVYNHAGGHHLVEMVDGELITVNSIHHQMMRPNKERSVILGWTAGRLSPKRFTDDRKPVESDEVEPEFVLFPDVKALGVQGHPEYSSPKSDITVMTRKLVKQHFNLDL